MAISILGKVTSRSSIANRLARLAEIAAARLIPLHHEVDVGIVDALVLRARADLEVDRIARAAVDQAMGDAAAGLEARRVAGLEHGLAIVFLEHELAFEHVDEFVLLLVPVPQRRRRSRLDACDVDAELGQPDSVTDLLL